MHSASYGAKGKSAETEGGRNDVEQIPKSEVYRKLRVATRNTKKGAYHNTKHAPELLTRIRPPRIKQASRNCRRMFDILGQRLSS